MDPSHQAKVLVAEPGLTRPHLLPGIKPRADADARIRPVSATRRRMETGEHPRDAPPVKAAGRSG